ncbi:TPA: TIGR03756 family integrating conjugative element protein [Klebsiella oxytoca]|nr:TIGR03756 family integrating conjugative element protein [Klebsiella oxytoca]
MNPPRLLRTCVLATALLPAAAPALNTAEIVASVLNPSCISWRVSGICYWLLCTPFGCTVKTSVKVSHFMPDAVVAVHNSPADTPWTEVSLLTSAAVEAASSLFPYAPGGGNNETKQHGTGDTRTRKMSLRFKDADVTGHPALAATSFNNFLGNLSSYSCSSVATAMQPYFFSTLDAIVWRSGLPETLYPEALKPGSRELGSKGDMWGNIYPRGGWSTQENDYKAAATTAQRAADLVTRSGQIHVYTPMTGAASPGYWPPGPVTENTGTKNHKWQRLTPSLSSSCAVFPDVTDDADFSSLTDEQAQYAWTLWRPYSCCQRRGQTFLYSTDF